MTSRELLEFAAKAAGIEYRSAGYRVTGIGETGMPLLAIWNPLTDDGDALRLAVKIGLDIEWRSDGRLVVYRHASANGEYFTAFESSRENKNSATRRAIVRAAAEIGKALP